LQIKAKTREGLERGHFMAIKTGGENSAENDGEKVIFEGVTNVGRVLVTNRRVVVDGVTIPVNQMTKVEKAEEWEESYVMMTFVILASGVGGFYLVFSLLFGKIPEFLYQLLGLPLLMVAIWGGCRLILIVYWFLFLQHRRPHALVRKRWFKIAIYTTGGRKELLGRSPVPYRFPSDDAEERTEFEKANGEVRTVIDHISQAIGSAATPSSSG
jgi:hypothetical protein